MVINGDREWIIKTPKSYAGDRYIDYPDFVSDKWRGIKGRIVHPPRILLQIDLTGCLSVTASRIFGSTT